MVFVLLAAFSYLALAALCISDPSDASHSPLPPLAWHLPLLGQHSHSYFFQSKHSTSGQWIVYASTQNVLGILDPSTSDLRWRIVFPQNESYITSTVCDETLVTLSTSTVFGTLLKLWSVEKGSLLSLHQLRHAGDTAPSASKLVCLPEGQFGLWRYPTFLHFGLNREPVPWMADPSHHILDVHANTRKIWALSHVGKTLFLVQGNDAPQATQLHVPRNAAKTAYLVCPENRSPTHVVVHSHDSSVRTFALSKDGAALVPLSLPADAVQRVLRVGIASTAPPILRIDQDAASLLIQLNTESFTILYHGEPVLDASVHMPSSSPPELLLLFRTHIALLLLKTEISATPVPPRVLAPFQQAPLQHRAFTMSGHGEKMLLATEEGHVQLWEAPARHNPGARLLWTRYEALVSPVAALVLDVPAAPHRWAEDDARTSVQRRWRERWQRHWRQLTTGAVLTRAPSRTFGFTKRILLLSTHSIVYAFDSADPPGHVRAWRKVPAGIRDMRLHRPTQGSEPAVVQLVGSAASAEASALYLQPFAEDLAVTPNPPTAPTESVSLEHSLQHPPPTRYGYALHPNGTLTGYKRSKASWVRLYSHTFPEPVLRTAKVDPAQPIASQGRILLADRSVQYKYLNPHMLAVVTGANQTLHLHLIDTVSGRFLYAAHVTDVDLRQPVHVLCVEHWTVLVYAAAPAGTWTATAIDLVEGARPAPTHAALRADRRAYAYVASFVLPVRGRVTALGVTCTRNNVAVRAVIVATDTSILAIARRHLDGLRAIPHPPENDIPAYTPVLPLDDRQTLSRTRVAVTSRLVAAPTELESTSMLLAYGHDLLWTPLTPSGAFDRLSTHFPKFGLLATCLALAVSAVVSRAMKFNGISSGSFTPPSKKCELYVAPNAMVNRRTDLAPLLPASSP